MFKLFYDELKQVIIVRMDLKMGKGKLATQVAHASIGAYRKTKKKHNDIVKRWEKQGEKTVVLKIGSVDELLKIKSLVDKENIPNVLIHDAGRTQVEPGTVTCLGIGPWASKVLDKYISDLKLA